MTHRGDSDWHGWPLQDVTDQVAQKQYAAMRANWPSTIQAKTPERLEDVPNHNPIKRQVKEAVLPSVTAVLDVINTMPHPILSELQMAFAELQAAYDRHEHGGVAQDDKCLRKIQHEILPRYAVVHLLKPRGGSQCGAAGETDADINSVTCQTCITQHDEITRED